MDKTTLRRIRLLHPKLRSEALEIYTDIMGEMKDGWGVRFTQTLRTFREQDDLYAIGRSKPGKKVTNARGGRSFHNYGLAIDICILTPKGGISWEVEKDHDGDGRPEWDICVEKFKARGWKWGGDWTRFKDRPHFEKSDHTISELLALHSQEAVDDDGYVLI